MSGEGQQQIEPLEKIAMSLERIARCLEAMESRQESIKDAATNERAQQKPNPDGDAGSSEGSGPGSFSACGETDCGKLADALFQKGIALEGVASPEAGGEQLDRIARYIGSRYESVKPFLVKLKSSIVIGKGFTMNLRGESQETMASITQLADNLRKMAYLSEYKYLKSPKYQLYACARIGGDVQNFFTGGWFERYVRVVVEDVMREVLAAEAAKGVGVFSNVSVILADGDRFELDHVVLANEKLYWFECKSGKNLNRYVAKYSDIANRYGFDRERSFLVLANDGELNVEFLNARSGVRIVGIDEFEFAFRQAFCADLPDARPISHDAAPTALPPTGVDAESDDSESTRSTVARIHEAVRNELAALESRLLSVIEDEVLRLQSGQSRPEKQDGSEAPDAWPEE